jgi:NitT/TauT family transport system permease protein
MPSYLLPSPSEVWQSLWPGLTENPTSRASLLYQFSITFKAAMIGLFFGAAAGITVGMVAAQFKWLERITMPYVFAIQTTPKVAIAPLLMIWFGFGLASEAILAGILAFFPLVVNTFTGMHLVDRERLRLFAALRASRMQVMTRLRMMTALPMILAGLEIAVVQALLGAVVAEFIAGQAGIGTQIVQFQSVSNTAGVFAAIIVLAAAGILLHTIVKFARTRFIFWHNAGDEG